MKFMTIAIVLMLAVNMFVACTEFGSFTFDSIASSEQVSVEFSSESEPIGSLVDITITLNNGHTKGEDFLVMLGNQNITDEISWNGNIGTVSRPMISGGAILTVTGVEEPSVVQTADLRLWAGGHMSGLRVWVFLGEENNDNEIVFENQIFHVTFISFQWEIIQIPVGGNVRIRWQYVPAYATRPTFDALGVGFSGPWVSYGIFRTWQHDFVVTEQLATRQIRMDFHR